MTGSAFIRDNFHLTRVFGQFHADYREPKFCDVTLMGGPGWSSSRIQCHRLVLALFSTWFERTLEDDIDAVMIPDLTHAEVQTLVDELYSILASLTSPRLLPLSVLREHPWLGHFLNLQTMPELEPELDIKFESLDSPEPNLFPGLVDMHEDDDVLTDPIPPSSSRSRRRKRPNYSMDTDSDWMLDSWSGSEDKDEMVEPISPMLDRSAASESDLDALESRPEVDSQLVGDSHGGLIPPKRPRRYNAEKLKHARQSLPKSSAELCQNTTLVNGKEFIRFVDVEAVREKVTKARGSLGIDFTTCGIRMPKFPKRLRDLTPIPHSFLVLCRICVDKAGIWAQPVAYTNPQTDELMVEQFQTCLRAFRDVFGICQSDQLSSKCILFSLGDGSRKTEVYRQNDKYKKRFRSSHARSDIQKHLEAPDVQASFEAPQIPTATVLTIPKQGWNLKLADNLNQCQGMAVIGVHEHATEFRQLELLPDNVESNAFLCMKTLFLVWSGGMASSKVRENATIITMYLQNSVTRYARRILKQIDHTEEQLQQNGGWSDSNRCKFCGRKFLPDLTQSAISQHYRQKHANQLYICGCEVEFKSLRERRSHFLTYHAPIPKNPEKARFEHMCHSCGDEFLGQPEHDVHAQSCEGLLKCEECGTEVEGLGRYFHHMRHMHPSKYDKPKSAYYFKCHPKAKQERGKLYKCDQCPMEFGKQFELRTHWSTVHGTESDRPYKCGQCQKSMVSKSRLKAHLLNVHLKKRPFVCRYAGCDAGFNASSNLYVHEKKLHGERLGPAVPLNLVISDEEMLSYGFVL